MISRVGLRRSRAFLRARLSSLEAGAQLARVEGAGRRRPDEVEQDLREALRVIEVGVVPRAGKISSLLSEMISWVVERMAHGDERILVSPDDESRKPLGQVELVGRAHELAADIDDASHGVEEGASRFGLLEGDEASPGLAEDPRPRAGRTSPSS